MLLNFIVIVQEPWKASVSEVNQITPRDGTEPRALDVNDADHRHWQGEVFVVYGSYIIYVFEGPCLYIGLEFGRSTVPIGNPTQIFGQKWVSSPAESLVSRAKIASKRILPGFPHVLQFRLNRSGGRGELRSGNEIK